MILSEMRYPLFRIMLWWSGSADGREPPIGVGPLAAGRIVICRAARGHKGGDAPNARRHRVKAAASVLRGQKGLPIVSDEQYLCQDLLAQYVKHLLRQEAPKLSLFQ